VPDFHLHQAELGGVALARRFAKVGLQRGEQGGFVPLQRVRQPLKLPAAERHEPGRAGLKEGTLTLGGGGKIHNRLGQCHVIGY
jgi:hypothetical protein